MKVIPNVSQAGIPKVTIPKTGKSLLMAGPKEAMVKKPYTVRVIYIVPVDAEPWPEMQSRALEILEDLQWFFAVEMDRLGYGPKTFEIAFDEEGALDFHQLNSEETKKQFEVDPRESSKRVVGGRQKKEDNVELCFVEVYSINNDELSGVFAKTKRQRCYLSSLYLKLTNREWLGNDMGYAGKTFPWIIPQPMTENILSWNGRGKALGDVSGSAYGVIAHELAHAFGLGHNISEDDERERKGHLMGLGVRGFRGVFRPDLTGDSCVLSKRDAELLNDNPFFAVRNLKPKSSAFRV